MRGTSKNSRNIYHVNHIGKKQLHVTGRADDIQWNGAYELTGFLSPWDNAKQRKTSFRALRDDMYLYFAFDVYENNLHVDKSGNAKANINNSDRVELFFTPDKRLNPYYCLEIDPTPRIMDFKAYPEKKFDFDWHWPKQHIFVKSFVGDQKYTVEGKISLASLNALGLIKNNKILTGIFRAKYNKQSDNSYMPTWITWVDPKTENPNFHISSSFGILHLGKN